MFMTCQSLGNGYCRYSELFLLLSTPRNMKTCCMKSAKGTLFKELYLASEFLHNV